MELPRFRFPRKVKPPPFLVSPARWNLREGALTVKDSSVIGQGTLLINGGLTVAVTSADGYSLDAGSTLGTINLDGGTATLAAALTLNGGSLSFGALSTDTAALTVNSVAGTALRLSR